MNYEEQKKCHEYLKNTDLVCFRQDPGFLGYDVRLWTKKGMSKYEWFAYFNDREHVFKVARKIECKAYPPYEIGTYEPDIAANFIEFKDLLERALKKYEDALHVQASRRKQLKEKEIKAAAENFCG